MNKASSWFADSLGTYNGRLYSGVDTLFENPVIKSWLIVSDSALYRFWSNSYRHHFYTASSAERDYVMATWPGTWSYEGSVFSVPACVDGTSPVYRFWSPTFNGHFYTINIAERNHVIATWPTDWTYEGSVFCAYTHAMPETKPVYRFWSSAYQGHFYTSNTAERDYVMATWPDIWTYEGVVFYAL
jgi:hypothetical protein